LWAIPGAHKNGLKSRFYRCKNGEGTEVEVVDDSAWETSKLVPLEVKTGIMVVLHGFLPLMSYANRSFRTRHAYTLHLIYKTENYSELNWLQRPPEMSLRGF
jgi:phytanoyl-CoA hydroxylase